MWLAVDVFSQASMPARFGTFIIYVIFYNFLRDLSRTFGRARKGCIRSAYTREKAMFGMDKALSVKENVPMTDRKKDPGRIVLDFLRRMMYNK